jgi:hypothetical protein
MSTFRHPLANKSDLPATGEHGVDSSVRFSTTPRRYSRASPWVTGRELPPEGVGPFNRVPDDYKPRVRRSRYLAGD